MKKLFIIAIVCFSGSLFAQDSAKLKPTVTLQARDCEIILFYTQRIDRAKFNDMDSVLLSKWRPPATNPTGTTNVTIDSVEARAWLQMFEYISRDFYCYAGGTVDRMTTQLTSTGHSWLTNKIVKANLSITDYWASIMRKDGREYGKKEKSGF